MGGVIEKPNKIELFKKAHLIYELPNYQFDSSKCWIEKGEEKSKLNLSTKEIFNIPVWSSFINLNNFEIDKRNKLNKTIIFIRYDQEKQLDLASLSNYTFKIILNKECPNIIIDKNTIIINPEEESHFDKVLEYLQSNNLKFDTIIHASSLNNNDLDLSNSLSYSFYSLFLIRQKLMNHLECKKLIILTNGLAQIAGSDIVFPANGVLVGSMRNIYHELPYIDTKIIDIGFNQENIICNILEIINNNLNIKNEKLIAIRFKKIWIENFQKTNSISSTINLIENGSTILVTGGLGGIALSITEYISKKIKNAKFILISRRNIYDVKDKSDYIKQKISIIQRIIKNGSSVDIRNIDISDRKQVKTLMEDLNIHYNLTGIIHTAGLQPLSTENYNMKNIKDVFGGKVFGIANIIDFIDLTKVKFIVMTSSLSSIIGDINRIEYCASNSYLDYLAADKMRFDKINIISINWPGWSDVGMVKDECNTTKKYESNKSNLMKNLNLNSLNSNEGSEIFYKLINQKEYNRVAISKLDIDALSTNLFGVNDKNSSEDKIEIKEENYNEIEYNIAKIFCGLLGLKKLSVYDDFFKIGGNSLLSVKLVSMLRKINVNFSLQEIVSCSTVRSIFNSQKKENIEQKILVPLKINNSKNKNLFLIHAVGGTIIGYKELSEKLTKFYNYYGIQNINIFGDQVVKANSLEDLASVYLEEILKQQPEGEYIIGGSSMGGTLAYEIARQLIEKGKVIKNIFMFDTWASFSEQFNNKETFLKEMKNQQDEYAECLNEICIDSFDKNNLLNSQWKLMQLLLNYKPLNLKNISITLFKAKNVSGLHITNKASPNNNWKDYCNEIKTYDVPGNHITILQNEGLKMIAKIINRILNGKL